ncbi:hypothetical protein CSUI_008799, partial [Cystoisospora suis]
MKDSRLDIVCGKAGQSSGASSDPLPRMEGGISEVCKGCRWNVKQFPADWLWRSVLNVLFVLDKLELFWLSCRNG